MQTAKKRVFTGEMDEMLMKLRKLQRVAEVAIQYRETYNDEHASHNEVEYAFEKLGEVLQEYELFLEGY